MSQLTLQQALEMIQGGLAHARGHQWRPMGVVVVDSAGQVMASAREDGASALRLDIALGKAGAAIGMGVNTRVLAGRSADMPVFFNAISAVSQQKFIPQTGAVLVTDTEGKLLGAVGASGGTGDEDEQLCFAGIRAVGLACA